MRLVSGLVKGRPAPVEVVERRVSNSGLVFVPGQRTKQEYIVELPEQTLRGWSTSVLPLSCSASCQTCRCSWLAACFVSRFVLLIKFNIIGLLVAVLGLPLGNLIKFIGRPVIFQVSYSCFFSGQLLARQKDCASCEASMLQQLV